MVLRRPSLDASGCFGRKTSKGALTGNAAVSIGMFSVGMTFKFDGAVFEI